MSAVLIVIAARYVLPGVWVTGVLAAVIVFGLRWVGGPSETATALAEVSIGGPFTLTDQNGRRVSDEEFRGRLMLVYFGYTFCPDVCPLGLTTIAEALDRLPAEDRDQIVPVFITVDPERDTVAVMKDYVGAFSDRLLTFCESTGAELVTTVRTTTTTLTNPAQPRHSLLPSTRPTPTSPPSRTRSSPTTSLASWRVRHRCRAPVLVR